MLQEDSTEKELEKNRNRALEQLQGLLHSYSRYELDGSTTPNYWPTPRCRVSTCKCHEDYTGKEEDAIAGIYHQKKFNIKDWTRDMQILGCLNKEYIAFREGGMFEEACRAIGTEQAVALISNPQGDAFGNLSQPDTVAG